jgi:pimeloyl-ACP methyl ester carboxylesterase
MVIGAVEVLIAASLPQAAYSVLMPVYMPRRTATSLILPLRGIPYHLHLWGDPAQATPQQPPLVLLHGWMDVGASFQFLVDALPGERCIVAPDWRGFGLSQMPAAVDTFYFADYLADLDALLDALVPQGAVDLAGHSMGGNVVTLYAGARPQRIRRLINLEGFGMPDGGPEQAPQRYTAWLDELKTPVRQRPYDTLADVAARMRQSNPRLSEDKALWLAPHWARQGEDGRWHLRADAAHKRLRPVLYRAPEAMACMRRTTAPVLFVEGAQTDVFDTPGRRYTRAEFEARIAATPTLERCVLDNAGHMLHHDQPQALAARLAAFLDAGAD